MAPPPRRHQSSREADSLGAVGRDQATGCAQVTGPPQQNLRRPGSVAPRPQKHGVSSCVQNLAGGGRGAPTTAQLRAAGFLREVKSRKVSAVGVRTLSSVCVTPADDG